MTTSDRVAPSQPLTSTEEQVAGLLSQGLGFEEIGEIMHISMRTARAHLANAGKKIAGDLPLRLRVIAWFRGGETWFCPPER